MRVLQKNIIILHLLVDSTANCDFLMVNEKSEEIICGFEKT